MAQARLKLLASGCTTDHKTEGFGIGWDSAPVCLMLWLCSFPHGRGFLVCVSTRDDDEQGTGMGDRDLRGWGRG